MKIIYGLLACFVSLVSAAAHALPEQTGEIISLQIHQNPTGNDPDSPRFMVILAGDSIPESNCEAASHWTGRFSNDAEAAMYSTLLALYIAGKPVRLNGTNADTCMGKGMLIRNVYAAY